MLTNVPVDEELYGTQSNQRQELDDGQVGAEAREDADYDLGVEDDGHWYMGRAREEFNRRRRGAEGLEDDDPIQVICMMIFASIWANAQGSGDTNAGAKNMSVRVTLVRRTTSTRLSVEAYAKRAQEMSCLRRLFSLDCVSSSHCCCTSVAGWLSASGAKSGNNGCSPSSPSSPNSPNSRHSSHDSHINSHRKVILRGMSGL